MFTMYVYDTFKMYPEGNHQNVCKNESEVLLLAHYCD